jgi:TonB-dependent starch-binding outer membrane protein SusC
MKKAINGLLFFLLYSSLNLFAQTVQLKGKVTTDAQDPLAGATVTLKGTTTSTVTDAEGLFSLNVTTTKGVYLVVTFTGKKAATVFADGNSTLSIVLENDNSANLEDVVVIGYQSIKRKDVLASVSSISSKDMKDIPVNSAAEALNGRLAGVTATTAEGSPDADVRIRVRGGMSITGDNSPLYIIDGVQMENALNFISPQDIKTIDVLKDAAATAIYGARGANGVIVITTKGGRQGKAKVNYNGFVGVKQLANKLKVFDPYEFVMYQAERSRGSSADSTSFHAKFWHYLGYPAGI